MLDERRCQLDAIDGSQRLGNRAVGFCRGGILLELCLVDTGHSHFGHGPLEPWEYSGANFPDRYQVLLFNSCLSFNYYDEDFLAMHPRGKDKLDVVVNGLPAYWQGMGQASASYVVGVLSGTQSWRQVLTSMAVNLPWQSGYDPMRAVNGELGNAYNPAQGAITITP